MNQQQIFAPDDFDLRRYGLYFKQFEITEQPFSGGTAEVTLTFDVMRTPLVGLRSLSDALKLVNDIHTAAHSTNPAIKKHFEELQILLALNNETTIN
jgi:hypothetical protein